MKKGFTLVELLGVVVILGVLAGISVPIVDGVVKRNKEKLQTVQKQEIIANVNSYLATQIFKLAKYDDIELRFNLLDVTSSGFGSYVVKDPITNKYLDFYNEIIVTKINGNININIDNLYLNQLDNIDSVEICTKDTIITNDDAILVTCNGNLATTTVVKEQLTNNLLNKVYVNNISRNVYVNYVGGAEQ